VEGELSPFRDLANDRLGCFAELHRELWPAVGHFMHWQNPERCVALINRMRQQVKGA